MEVVTGKKRLRSKNNHHTCWEHKTGRQDNKYSGRWK